MNNLSQIRHELRLFSNKERAKVSARYFKTAEGEYGYGDIFLGLSVPQVQAIAQKNFRTTAFRDVVFLLKSRIHEERQLALLILTRKFKSALALEQEQIFNLYLTHTGFVNNWDLVDGSAPTIIGGYLFDRDRRVLDRLAVSDNLWERRIAIIATYFFTCKNQPNDTLRIAETLLNDRHDLIHKGVGWMLREAGKRCSQDVLERFLKKHYKNMPRTMLRYAVERFPEKLRRAYIEGKI